MGSAKPNNIPIEQTVNPTIEIFRGTAAIFVLIHHYAFYIQESNPQLPLGALHFFHSGVDMFFVITGFVFSPYVIAQKSERVTVFVIRRVFRIYPLYVLSLVLSIALIQESPANLVEIIIKHMFFLQTTSTLEVAKKINEVYWTLPVEVEYYIFIAVLLGFPKPKASTVKPLSKNLYVGASLCAAFSGLGLVIFQIKSGSGDRDWIMSQVHLPTLFGEFIMGIVVFQAQSILSNCKIARQILAISGCVLVCSLFLFYGIYHANGDRPLGWFNLLCALGYAQLFAAALATWKTDGLKGYPARVGIWLGTISYPIYLFHSPTMAVLRKQLNGFSVELIVLFGIVVTLLLADILHRKIEVPCRSWGRRLASSQRFNQ